MATNDRTMKLKSNEDDIFEVDGDIIKQLGILEGFESSKKNKLRLITCFQCFFFYLKKAETMMLFH
jgi:hypothetical protein